MALELMKEKWTGKINEVTIGATKESGGTRTSTVTVGGEEGLSYLPAESKMPHRPVIAMEVWDIAPVDWPEVLTKPFADALKDPAPDVKFYQFASSSIQLKFSLWVASADFGRLKDKVQRDIKQAFERQNINIPYPHMNLHIEK